MQIRITGRREGAVAIIEVSDTGPGVPAKAREHLFEAFQTSGRPGGSGLGLAIAAELVRAHGGDIHLVEGTIGATFRISIPDRPVELQCATRRARAGDCDVPSAGDRGGPGIQYFRNIRRLEDAAARSDGTTPSMSRRAHRPRWQLANGSRSL